MDIVLSIVVLFLFQCIFILPVTGGAGWLIGIILGKIMKKPDFWRQGRAIGLLIGLAISAYFAATLPCGIFGC